MSAGRSRERSREHYKGGTMPIQHSGWPGRESNAHELLPAMAGKSRLEMAFRRGGQGRCPVRVGAEGLMKPALGAPPAPAASAASTAFPRLVAVPAIDRAVATRLKRYGCWLTAPRTNHRSSLCRSRTVARPPLIVLLCLTARLATLRGRVTTFLKERLIRSGKRKILSAIATRELNIAGHESPYGDCIVQSNW
jgi:hypothetical protein